MSWLRPGSVRPTPTTTLSAVLRPAPVDTVQRPQRPQRRGMVWDRVLALLLVLATVAVGGGRLRGELTGQGTRASAVDVPRVEGLPVLRAVGPDRTRFLGFVRRLVPAGEPVRIVQQAGTRGPFEARPTGQPGVCGYATSTHAYWWLVYALSPRPSVCDRDARWTVYYGVTPPAVPPPARLYRFAPRYAVVRR